MGLRLAARDNKRIDLSDGAWIEVSSEMSKRDFISVMSGLPDSAAKVEGEKASLNIRDAGAFQRLLFDVLVKSWSLDVPVSVEAYLDLERTGADEIDSVLVKHFTAEVAPAEAEPGKPLTSRGKQPKGSTPTA